MAKKTNMYGVIFDEGTKTRGPVVDNPISDFYLPFDKTEEFFQVYENEINFYRGVEKLVRTDDFYKVYIRYLIDVVGMDCCQIMPNIKAEEKSNVTLEMHHGPILTLFDIVLIIMNYLRYYEKPVTTFDVADIVLDEHQKNRVRVVLVNKTAHKLIHENKIILNYNQGFGNTNAFLQAYREGVTPDIRNRINKYIEWSRNNDSFDNGVLEVAQTLRRWENNDWESFTVHSLVTEDDMESEDETEEES